MFRGNRKYGFVLVACFAALMLLQIYAPKPIDWRVSYVKKEKIPYGTAALYSTLPTIFPSQKIQDATLPIYNTLNKTKQVGWNYIFINSTFNPDTLDVRELLGFVARGNTVFIAANNFEGRFADTMKINTSDYIDFTTIAHGDSSILANLYKGRDSSKVNFTNPQLKKAERYIYTKGIEGSYFSSFDTLKNSVLGDDANGKTNFLKIKVGEGHIYLSTLPEVFSNYHFVDTNYSYVYKALSYLPNAPTIWDEYYKVGNVKSDNPLRVIFDNPLLLNAYYLLMVSLILFMVFGAKRKQRIIPVIEPYRNTTLQFIDIVGALYYQTGNHKNIAEKKITYFLEHIRKTFQVKTTIYDDTFITRIANLSGIDWQQVHDLFYYFSDLSFKQDITQQELLKLNTMIENFHKLSKR
jgi:hypothetical protein